MASDILGVVLIAIDIIRDLYAFHTEQLNLLHTAEAKLIRLSASLKALGLLNNLPPHCNESLEQYRNTLLRIVSGCEIMRLNNQLVRRPNNWLGGSWNFLTGRISL